MLNKSRVAYVRLSPEDHAALRSLAAKVELSLSEYLRRAGLRAPVRIVPGVNRQAWIELARTAANLNQIARHLNQARAAGREPVVHADSLRRTLRRLERQLKGLRRLLIGREP